MRTVYAPQTGWASIIGAVGGSPYRLLALIVLGINAIPAVALPAVPSDQRLTIVVIMAFLNLAVLASGTWLARGPLKHLEAKTDPELVGPLSDPEKETQLQQHQQSVLGANLPPLTLDDHAKRLQLLKTVIHQAPRYSTPTYFLDAHLHVIHWNVAFELLFRPILHRIRRRHVNFFIAELANSSDVFNHARDFTEDVNRGSLPLVDFEPLFYESPDYGTVVFEKVATQLTDGDANLKAWAVALLLKQIEWKLFSEDLRKRMQDDKLWSVYAVSYDAVLSTFAPYKELIKEVVQGIPCGSGRVLELGAGTGNVTKELLARGLQVTAVENNPAMLERLDQKRLRNFGPLTLVVESFEDTTFGDQTNFDAAVAVNVAYALDDPAGCFRKVANALKPGAVFALSTTHSETSLDRLLDAIKRSLIDNGTFQQVREHYEMLVGVNRHIELNLAKRYTRQQYVEWLEQAGLAVFYNQPSYEGAVVVIYARKM